MKTNKNYQALIIGAGPAGLLTALELNKNNISALVVEKNSSIGGMAFNTDVTLQNSDGSSSNSSLGKRLFGTKKIEEKYTRYVYDLFYKFGLEKKRSNFKKKDKINKKEIEIKNLKCFTPAAFPVDKTTLRGMLNKMTLGLSKDNIVNILTNTNIKEIQKGKTKRWRVLLNKYPSGFIEVDNIVLATGKLSVLWLIKIMDLLKISYRNNQKISIGVRLEGQASLLNKIAPSCPNPKIKTINKNVQTESFCWCKNGGVIAYSFSGITVLDGLHLHNNPSVNTSLGIIVTINLPSGCSNASFGINFTKYINSIGEKKVLLQRLGDFKNNKTTSSTAIAKNKVKPSLKTFKLVDIKQYYPPLISGNLLEFIDKVNQLYPDTITDDCLLYAPIIERIFPDISLSNQMESSQKGIFFAGDCSGKAIGVIPACIMGVVAARCIAKKLNE